MFKYFKLKKTKLKLDVNNIQLDETKLQLEILLLNKINNFVDKFSELAENSQDIIEVANKLKDVDKNDAVKDIVNIIKK